MVRRALHANDRPDRAAAFLYPTASRRNGAVTVALLVVLAVPFAATDTSLAGFLNPLTAGKQALASATLTTPAGLATANGGCAGGSEKTNVAVTWTASAELDANGNPLINGYTVLRSISSGGSYSSVGST